MENIKETKPHVKFWKVCANFLIGLFIASGLAGYIINAELKKRKLLNSMEEISSTAQSIEVAWNEAMSKAAVLSEPTIAINLTEKEYIIANIMNESARYKDKNDQREAFRSIASSMRNLKDYERLSNYKQLVFMKSGKTCIYSWVCQNRTFDINILKKDPSFALADEVATDLVKGRLRDTVKGATHYIVAKNLATAASGSKWHRDLMANKRLCSVGTFYEHEFFYINENGKPCNGGV